MGNPDRIAGLPTQPDSLERDKKGQGRTSEAKPHRGACLCCVPIFSSDGLKHYFYAITAHFGFWSLPKGAKKPVWRVWPSLLYGQVMKHHQRRKLVKVEQRVLCGEKADFVSRLKALDLTGIINTSFVERLNLTIREGVSKLARRT